MKGLLATVYLAFGPNAATARGSVDASEHPAKVHCRHDHGCRDTVLPCIVVDVWQRGLRVCAYSRRSAASAFHFLLAESLASACTIARCFVNHCRRSFCCVSVIRCAVEESIFK